MSRDDVFLVRHSSLPPIGESVAERAIINRMGMQIVTDFFTQLVLSGMCYHMQLGTEDAGVNSTTAMDDQLSSLVMDNNAGYAAIPLLYETTPGVLATATIVQSMLEIDTAQKRYSSGGTAFVPRNMHGQSPQSWNGVAYVGPDVTIAAKTAVPNSVEFARAFFIEDAIADSLGYPGSWNTTVFSCKTRPMFVTYGASSLVGHFGSATADVTGYAVLQAAQLAIAQVNAT